jgi:hypothetical protein
MRRTLKQIAPTVLSLLALVLTAAPAFAETYQVSWDAVTGYSDGAPFEAGKSVTYTVYWSTDSSLSAASLHAIATGTSATSASFDPTTAGMTRGQTVYLTVKSILNSGEESGLAPGVAWSVPRKTPGTPGGTKIIKI